MRNLEDDSHFQIERVKSRLKNNKEIFDAKMELENLIKNGIIGSNKQLERKQINANSTENRSRRSKSVRPKFLLKKGRQSKRKKKKRKNYSKKIRTQ